eukprot:366227-Chlamydomonas_euryale.AAC.32
MRHAVSPASPSRLSPTFHGPGSQATLKASSSMVGLTVRQAAFGMRFGAAVVSLSKPPPLPSSERREVAAAAASAPVAGDGSGADSGIRRRNGTKLGDTVLEAGHQLLLDVGGWRLENWVRILVWLLDVGGSRMSGMWG